MSRMPWTKLRTGIRERFAPSLRDRVAVHQARYRHAREEIGRVWLTLDRRELISFDTSRYTARRAKLAQQILSTSGSSAISADAGEAEHFAADLAAKDALRRAGEYDDYSALEDLEWYLSLGVEEALISHSPLVRALAVVDRRIGKRRLRSLAGAADEHPLVRMLVEARCAAEGIAIEYASNKPLQPTRAAQASSEREQRGSGPRG